MSLPSLALRFACLLGLVAWVGGFTFYSGVVIPILHDLFGVTEAAEVTRRATDAINLVGLVALAFWWTAAAVGRREGPARLRRVRDGLLVSTSVLWLVLVALHRVMDRRLDAGSLRGFYPLHRAYLMASTLQWLANLGWLGASLALWAGPGKSPAPAEVERSED